MQLTLMEGKELGYKLECERLGTMLQGDGGCDKEVTRRLALARVKYNGLMWLWHDCKVSMDLKTRIYESNVLSSVVWGSKGWLLMETIEKKRNGWNNHCLSLIMGKTAREEASPRMQSMCLPGIIRFRRMVWLGHLLCTADGCLERWVVLKYAELVRRKRGDDIGSTSLRSTRMTSRLLPRPSYNLFSRPSTIYSAFVALLRMRLPHYH
jgi:hypothetical protein